MDTQNQFDAQQQPSPTASRTAVNSVEGKELKKDTKTSIYLSNRIEQRTQLLVHLLGYALLAFSLLDYVHIVTPPRFTDPVSILLG
jgi:hypothetical protein